MKLSQDVGGMLKGGRFEVIRELETDLFQCKFFFFALKISPMD
jgi:hypothetical protein